MKANVKRMIPLLLVIVMCLIVLPGMVYAASGDPTLIDTTKTGSITVTKYASTSTTGRGEATGTTNDQSSIAPGYQTLKDAEFVLVKIYDSDKVMEYYNGTADTLVLDTTKLVKDSAVWKYNGNVVDDANVKTGKTDASGVLVFNDLPVGIYILREITAPSQITTPLAETSLISIPMVNTKTSSNNGNGEWMYDVYVYPKNHEATGTVELTKVQQNGSTPLEGVKFSLEKLNVTTNTWETVSSITQNNGTTVDITETTLTTDANGMIKLKNLPANLKGTQYRLVENTAPDGYIVNKIPLYFKVNTDNTITWNTGTGNANGCNNINGDVLSATQKAGDASTLQIKLRNERPDLTKEVHENGTGDTWKNDEQYRLDDVITYRLKTYVPNNVDELGTYKIEDTPQVGITDNLSSVTVSYEDSGTTKTLTTSDFTVNTITATETNGNGFTLTLNKPANTNIKGKEITIQYTANMNANAVIAGKGNGNTATLTYSKDINGTPDETYTITDEARVYTYQYQITKHKDSATGDPIKDVQFELLDDGKNKMSVVALTDPGEYRLALTRDTGTTQTLTTKDDGTILIKGLENGTYYLKETKTIDGYNLLSKPFEIEVGVYEETTWTSDTGYTSTGRSVKKYQSTNFYKDNTKSTPFSDNKAITNTDIINKQGFVLPQTGGMGYLLFCVAGIVLIGGGAMLIFGGRKKKIR